MKCLRLAAAFGGILLMAQVRPTTPADVTGDGVAHQFAASGTARTIQVIAASGNSAACRLGDSTVTTSRGLPIAAGGGIFYPPLTGDTREAVNVRFYDLTAHYYICSSGDTLSFQFER